MVGMIFVQQMMLIRREGIVVLNDSSVVAFLWLMLFLNTANGRDLKTTV